MWHIETLEMSGGFLPGLKLSLPPGLTCIIGPRGSGKSTLAEAIRFVLCGITSLPKPRLELIQANLGEGSLVSLATSSPGGTHHSIKRGYKQPAVLLASDGRAISTVDLERGTFLPIDAYNSVEIESIADEQLGARRRGLLDDLRGDELQQIHLSLGEHSRSLEANADQIRAATRTIADLTEQIEEMGDVRAKLSALGPPSKNEASEEFRQAARQHQINPREARDLESSKIALTLIRNDLSANQTKLSNLTPNEFDENQSSNAVLLRAGEAPVRKLVSEAVRDVMSAIRKLENAESSLVETQKQLIALHRDQAALFTKLNETNQAASAQVRHRTALDQQVLRLQEIEKTRTTARTTLDRLRSERKILKATYLSERGRVSDVRESVAKVLQAEAGGSVRVRVLRHSDDLAYKQSLMDGLKGARVRSHDDILTGLLTLRPEHLAQLLETNDAESFEESMSLGAERSRKILDALRANLDPLRLEVAAIDDRVMIELNVGSSSEPNFKDASDLSRGQKCTALLPLLLARTRNPLLIDQPEDNLDNHFIYETVVGSIQRLKGQRQMIFITHNANIPVLAGADLVVVMNSDGKVGYVEKQGTVDQCRNEIVDLLEGGREAFELRSQCYGRS